MVRDHKSSEAGHEEARPGVDGEHGGEAGGALHDRVEARVERVAQDGDGESEAAAERAHPPWEHLGGDQVHHGVDAKGVGDEHEDGDDEGGDAKVEREEGLSPV